MTGRLFSFCKNKRIHRDLGFHPEQVLIRKEVGHNEHKEFLSFVQELGSQQLRMKQSMWLVGLYWTWDFSSRIDAKSKEGREGERERQIERYHCAVGGTPLKGID